MFRLNKPTFKISVPTVLVVLIWLSMLTKGVCTAFWILAELAVVSCIGAIVQVRTGQCVDTATISCSFLRLVDWAIFDLCIRRAGRAPSGRTDCSFVFVAERRAANLPSLRFSKRKQTKPNLSIDALVSVRRYVTFFVFETKRNLEFIFLRKLHYRLIETPHPLTARNNH